MASTLSPVCEGENPSSGPVRPRHRRGAVNLVKCTAPPSRAGTNAGYRTGCRCPRCTDGARVAALRRRQQIAFGRWDPFVDAGLVRAHVEALRAAGMGPKTIAAEAGVAYTVVIRLLYAVGGSPRSRRVRRGNAEALFACQPRPAAGARVDGTGTRRRLEALMVLGWSKWALAREIGCRPDRVLQLMRGPRVTASSAEAVRALFERLSMTPPQVTDRWAATSVTRTINYAKARGFVPPLAWDEESIDDPAAGPSLTVGAVFGRDDLTVDLLVDGELAGGRARPEERREAIRILAERGWATADIATWLGLSTKAVARLRERHGFGAEQMAAAS